jgi:hypothetical protein
MTERVMGLSLDEADKIKNTEIAKELCLPPVKLHCSSKLSFYDTHYQSLMSLKCWLRMLFDQLSEITVPNGQTELPQDSSMYHKLRPVMQRLHLPASKKKKLPYFVFQHFYTATLYLYINMLCISKRSTLKFYIDI